jgi:hypothetical protein
MSKNENLRKKLEGNSIVKVGGAFDAMSAKLVESSGCVADIAKLPAQTASNPLLSTNFADIASNAPPTLTMEFPSNFFRRFSFFDIF